MTTTFIPEEGKEAIAAVIQVAQEVLANDLRSIYGMGSLGYGGFVNEWSDFDIDVILEDEADADIIQVMNAIEGKIHSMGFVRVDVKCYSIKELNADNLPYPYGTRNRAVMLCDSASLLFGEDVSKIVTRPSLEELRKESIGLLQAFLGREDGWWFSRPIDDTAAILALPARLIYTCETGKVTHKANAIDRFMQVYEKDLSPEVWNWILWARACREFTYARNLPKDLYDAAITAAREQFIWVEKQLLYKYEVSVS